MQTKNLTSSIIIPYYNGGEFLLQTLDSISNQSLLPNEVILVNDGSTDTISIDILSNLPNYKFKKITIFSKENGGISSALSYGAKKASGDIIFTVDSDDILDKNYIKEYLEVFINNENIDAVISGYKKFFSNIGYSHERCFHKYFMPKGIKFPDLYYYNCGGGSNMAIRKKILSKVGYWDSFFNCYQDWGMWLKLSLHNKNLYVIKKYLYFYRLHINSNMHLSSIQKKRDNIVYTYLSKNFLEVKNLSFEEYLAKQKVFMSTKKNVGHFRPFTFSLLYLKQVILTIKEKYF